MIFVQYNTSSYLYSKYDSLSYKHPARRFSFYFSPDSLYMALSGQHLEELVKPELKDEFNSIKDLWFPRTDTNDHAVFDARTPGK